jgi:GMP synthase (glutamine-hydrolysing)
MSKSESGIVYIMDMESGLSDALMRRIHDMNQYSVFRRWDMDVDPRAEVEAYQKELKAIIISGSAKNVNSKKRIPPNVPAEILQVGVPILGICYGMQWIAKLNGVPVIRCWDEPDPNKRTKNRAKKDKGEQGAVWLQRTEEDSPLFQGLGSTFPVWMKHNWMLGDIPEGWKHLARTDKCPIAAIEKDNVFALQFHPEPYNSLFGKVVLNNFLTRICGLETPYF